MRSQIIISILLFINSLCTVVPSQANDAIINSFKWKEFPDLPAGKNQKKQHGLASPFGGTHNDVVIVAGGCNFPEKPVYEGGAKRYYSDLFVLLEDEDGKPTWLSGYNLDREVAYGASVSTKYGVLFIGGNNSEQHFKQVDCVAWNNKESKINVEKWPELPFSMERMGAALVEDKVFVVGGLSDGKLKNTLLMLDLSKYGNDDFQWEVMPSFPGPARLQPLAVGQNDAEEGHLYVFGGSSFPDDADTPSITTDGLEFNPKTNAWSATSIITDDEQSRVSMHGACGVAEGVNHIIAIGGVNYNRFNDAWLKERLGKKANEANDTVAINQYLTWKYEYLTQPVEWYMFSRKVMAYHSVTDSWAAVAEYPFPGPAGAVMVPWKKGWLVINGEVKPGERSSKVYYGEIEYDPVFGWLNWTLLIVYLGGMLYLGYFFMQRERSANDFFTGGGRIPWWAAGMSIFATMLSAITFMAIPAKTMATDWKYFPMAVTILLMAFPVVKYYLPFFRRLNVTTAYEYLEKRFNYTVRFLASFLFMIFMVARMALVLFLPSLALTTVTGIDIYICIILMGVITIVYCTMGGVEAVVWGDVIQGFVLLGGAIVAVVFLVLGTDGGASRLIDITIEHHKLQMFDFAFDLSSATFWVVLLGGLANNLISYSADQTVIQRYLTTKDEKSAGQSIVFNGFMSVGVSVVFYFIGTALFAYYKTQPAELNMVMENPDSIFPHFIMTKLPIGMAGLLIAAIFAATMSTVSSNINSLSTAFTSDFFNHFFPKVSDRNQLAVARWSGIVLGGIGVAFAVLMATWNILSLFDYFNYILGLLASGLGGLFFMGIFIPKIDQRSALIGFFAGTGILFWISMNTNISFLLFGFIGMFLTVAVAWLISLIIPAKERDLEGLTWSTIKKS
ncbi:cyclically-permuted mutarotase family protein [Puteibacter caeruleilacunae]|nr:cyclically-permuted mutarotase family protein [Puteibacter caeruleilacunae]